MPHRDDEPAIIRVNGDQLWYRDGVPHRDEVRRRETKTYHRQPSPLPDHHLCGYFRYDAIVF